MPAVYLTGLFRSYPSSFGFAIETPSDIDFSAVYELNGREQELTCIIRNNSDKKISYGEAFFIEREKDGQWFEIGDITGKREDERAYPALAHSIPAGSENAFPVSLDGFRMLPKDNYRIVIRIASGENSVPTDVIAACFSVE